MKDHPDYVAFKNLMAGTGEIIGYDDNNKPIRNKAPWYSHSELKLILKSEQFKRFAALFPSSDPGTASTSGAPTGPTAREAERRITPNCQDTRA